MSDLFQTIVALLSALSLLCVALTFAPSFYADLLDNALSHRPKAYSVIFIALALGGWATVLYHGVYALLWFLPDSWGRWDEDEWRTARHGLSITLAAWGIFGLGHYGKQLAYSYLAQERAQREKEDARR
jgi:hypothetical protein